VVLPSARRNERPSPVVAPVGHVFISYARVDSAKVAALQQTLEAAGFRVWLDVSALWPGEDWRMKIRDAITCDALVFLACFSRASVAREKGYQNEELGLAIDELRQRRPDVPWLIPIRFDACAIPDFPIGLGRTLRALHAADLFGEGADEATARLITGIRRLLPAAPHAVRPGNPSEPQLTPFPDAVMPPSGAARGTRITTARRRRALIVLGPAVVAIAVVAAVVLSNLTSPSAPQDPPVIAEAVSRVQTLDEVSFVTPRPSVLSTAQLSALNSSATAGNSEYEAWLLDHGAVPTGLGLISVTIVGNSVTPVTITQMQVVKQCAQPLTGTLFYDPSNVGGPTSVPTVYFDLDTAVTVGTYAPPTGSGKAAGGSFFAKEVVKLGLHEQQTLAIQVRTARQYCTFTFQLTIATSSGQATETIDDNGRPFALTAANNGPFSGPPYSAYHVIYAGGKANAQHGGTFIRVDPERYDGTGDPESYKLGG